MADVEATIDALLSENRVFEPSEEFRAQALWSDPSIYERAAATVLTRRMTASVLLIKGVGGGWDRSRL